MATICPYSEDFQKAVSRQRQKGSESEQVADRTKYFEVLLLAERPCRIMRVCKDLESWSRVVEGVEMSIECLNTGMLVFLSLVYWMVPEAYLRSAEVSISPREKNLPFPPHLSQHMYTSSIPKCYEKTPMRSSYPFIFRKPTTSRRNESMSVISYALP